MAKLCFYCKADITIYSRRICQDCSDSRRGEQRKAARLVASARAVGLLPTHGTCADCGTETALCYDHRDYSKPLDVTPLCRTCNIKRGPANWINPSVAVYSTPLDEHKIMSSYTMLLEELEAIRARRRRSEEENTRAWLEQVAQIVRSASDELEQDLDRYDERKAREMSEAEHDALERARDCQIEAQTWERGE